MTLGIAHAIRERFRRDGLVVGAFHAAVVVASTAGLAFGMGVAAVAMAVLDAPGALRQAAFRRAGGGR